MGYARMRGNATGLDRGFQYSLVAGSPPSSARSARRIGVDPLQ
jgi:hypothetical protein